MNNLNEQLFKAVKSNKIDEVRKLIKEEAYRDWETDRKSTRLNSSH